MEVLAFLAPWVLLGIAVVFVAFSGGPGRAREAYLTRGNTLFKVAIPVIFLGMGIAIPAVVIAGREDATGGKGQLAEAEPNEQLEEGKALFRQTCSQCHSLGAVNARGVTGPNLDDIGQVNKDRVLQAIRNGGTGQNRMPANLLEGPDAEAVAAYVAATAGKGD
jgi:cytochrome c553